ncbi:UNVERIFIED_CONTAM: hypothetical protein FKN15_002372 [Acipenser sinensis]
MDPVQKAVMNHTFGAPLIRTKRAVISCNVCQIRFNSESQAEAHYKGNRHARRVRGIETSKSRPRENDKPLLLPPPAPSTSNLGESEASRVDPSREQLSPEHHLPSIRTSGAPRHSEPHSPFQIHLESSSALNITYPRSGPQQSLGTLNHTYLFRSILRAAQP